MSTSATDNWISLWAKIDAFLESLRRSEAIHVNSSKLRDLAKELVQHYFRLVRPELEALRQPVEHIGRFDETMQRLLELSNGRNPKTSYQGLIRDLRRFRPVVEFERELLIGKRMSASASAGALHSGLEQAILKTLSDMIPSAALSYQQALVDLTDPQRVSVRGTAAELRETLREVLDYLAPDADVMRADGFVLEKGRDRPTMKQKARFILRSRGMSKTAVATPEAAVQRVEEGTASLARSVYERGSVSTHVASTRREVQQLKLYVEGILAELLEIQV